MLDKYWYSDKDVSLMGLPFYGHDLDLSVCV
jgi:hypothetical protein